MIMNTRHLVADPNYSSAINLIPIEFNSNKNVTRAWHDYIGQVRYKPTEANRGEHDNMIAAKQTTLIYQIMRSLGFNLSETDIQTSAYVSEGAIIRDNMYLASLHAHSRIANTLEKQTSFVEGATVGRQPREKGPPKRGLKKRLK